MSDQMSLLPVVHDALVPSYLTLRPAQNPIGTLYYINADFNDDGTGGPRWKIEGSPLVIVAAMKALSGVVARQRDRCSFPATQANFEDLLLVMQRYQIKIDVRAEAVFAKGLEFLVSAYRARNGMEVERKPAGLFKGEYLDFQREGVDFMFGQRRCLNADDMGLGKTIQAFEGAGHQIDPLRLLLSFHTRICSRLLAPLHSQRCSC